MNLPKKNANKEIQEIISSIEKGDFNRAKKKLSIPRIEEEENVIARKRLLRGNLEEIEKDYDNAELNYQKATQIGCKSKLRGDIFE